MSDMIRNLKTKNPNHDEKWSVFAQGTEDPVSWMKFSAEGTQVCLKGQPS